MSENSEGVAVLPDFAFQNCSRPSINLEGKAGHVTGYDFNQGLDYFNLLASLASTGFQASQLGRAVHAVNEMVDVLCTTAGGIEEDLMKSMSPSFLADFSLPGASLHEKGLKRIGNLVVPNNSYTDFGRWLKPILDQLLIEQNEEGINWTPSKFISRLGKELNHQDSICYWAYTNNIPIYCPAITDGAIGDSLFFHSHSNPGLRMDIVEDIGRIAYEALSACPRKTGMIILGGGLAKHHVCNANLMRDGADFAVYINTAQEFDGSDSGAKPDEAKSWGKIKAAAKAVKVHCDASIAFPLLVAQTFAPRVLQSGIEQRNGFVVQNQVLSMANGCASAKQPTYLQSVELERP